MANWKNGATLVALLVVALVAFVIIDASVARREAIDTAATIADDAAASQRAASRRIDMLLAEIRLLGDEAAANGVRLGEMQAQIYALQVQLEQSGVNPVVPRQPETSAPPTTATTTPPSPPTTVCERNGAGRCKNPNQRGKP